MPSARQRHNVHESGGGERPMLFAHGFGCDQNMWRYVAPEFERDFRVVLYDLAGAGRYEAGAYDPTRYRSLDGHADDVLQLCRELELEDVVFVGHSVSSMIGALAAIAEPERFSHLLMIGPSPCYVDDPEVSYVGGFSRQDLAGLLDMMDRNYLGWASFLAPVVMKNADRPELVGELEESFCSTDPTFARQFAEATFFSDNRQDLPRVTTPALVLQCSDDSLAPVAVGEYVVAHLAGEARLHQLAATGHCPHMSHPEETIAAMRAYLSAAGVP